MRWCSPFYFYLFLYLFLLFLYKKNLLLKIKTKKQQQQKTTTKKLLLLKEADSEYDCYQMYYCSIKGREGITIGGAEFMLYSSSHTHNGVIANPNGSLSRILVHIEQH